jgi:hypothetical protein
VAGETNGSPSFGGRRRIHGSETTAEPSAARGSQTLKTSGVRADLGNGSHP